MIEMMNENLIRSRAPLRLGLAGGGSDVSPFCDMHGGAIINVTIDKYAYASVRQRTDDKIIFNSVDMGTLESFDVHEETASQSVLKLHRGVYERMIADFN